MEYLEYIKEFIELLDISKNFGIDIKSFLVFIIGGIIVGFICLTLYYRVYGNNKRWVNLLFYEKTIISLVIGILSILASLFFIVLYQIIMVNNDSLQQLFIQLQYIGPFLYFIAFAALTMKYKYKGLDFIKKYILYTFIIVACLNFLLLLFIMIIAQNIRGIILTIILILSFILLTFPTFMKKK